MAKTYSEKLRDPRWQKKRLEILTRDKWHCQICFDSETMLVVHHRYYITGAQPWEYPDDALVVLCDNCHNEEYDMAGVYQDLKTALGKAGAFARDVSGLVSALNESGLLNEQDWSILEEELGMLLRSKKENGQAWNDAWERASKAWEARADKLDGKS